MTYWIDICILNGKNSTPKEVKIGLGVGGEKLRYCEGL